jgi:multidrug efflux pump subunit AcrB
MIPNRNLVGTFAQHRVAANLLMALMIMAGIWSLSRLNTQFFPNFELDRISVRVVWSGAAAEDVETAIVNPMERELRNLDGLRKITSTSADGVASITLEYEEGSDMGTALDEVKQRVDLVRNLPTTAEEPEISRIVRYDPIARLMLAGPSLAELRHLARRFERELLDRGIAKVSISGLPEEEMAIQFSDTTLQELGVSLPAVAQRLAGLSRDMPAGVVGQDHVARQLRSLDQRRDAAGFADLPLRAGQMAD